MAVARYRYSGGARPAGWETGLHRGMHHKLTGEPTATNKFLESTATNKFTWLGMDTVTLGSKEWFFCFRDLIIWS